MLANQATVYTGTSGNDNYLIRRDGTGTKYEILIGGTLRYTLTASIIPSLAYYMACLDELIHPSPDREIRCRWSVAKIPPTLAGVNGRPLAVLGRFLVRQNFPHSIICKSAGGR